VEVKIGVQQSTREIVLESTQSGEEIVALVSAAVADGTTLSLTDDKGRIVMVPGEKIAYVELGVTESRKVGFGSS
jgi:hypothetical protein